MNHLRDSEVRLAEADDANKERLVNDYTQAKADYELYESEKIRGQVLRSKCQWAEEGERSSKYFLNLEKYNQEHKTISLL